MNPSTTPTFVLVHGSWHGAWCWRRVQPWLREAGFDSHAVTLTGVGERRHLLSAQITLQTHVDDVLNLIEAEELERVVLVGHSYGGLVITQVAATLAKRLPGVLQHLVYVDAHTPKDGESWFDLMEPATAGARVTVGQTVGGGVFLPPPDAAVFGLQGADRDWVNRRQTPQPFGVFDSKVRTDDALMAVTPRTFIDCVNPMLDLLAISRARVKADASWRYCAMDTGHDPMVSEPQALAQLLVEAARA